MALNNQELSDIALEFAKTEDNIKNAKLSIPEIDKQVVAMNEATARSKVLYTRANENTVDKYHSEIRWLTGTTYTPITQAQINAAATRSTGNIFFPITWDKSNAMLTPSGSGLPTTTSGDSEQNALTRSLTTNGLVALVNLLLNGQSSGVGGTTLSISSYSPGAATIKTVSGGQTPGSLLYISGSGTSAVVVVNSITYFPIDLVGPPIVPVAYYEISITEFIPPAGTISIGGSVIQNIPGFSNSERNTLTSGSYQRILTEITNKIIATASLWSTALTNQMSQQSTNESDKDENAIAKVNSQTAKTAYDTWSAKTNTGADGKFVDVNILPLQSAYNVRVSAIPTRVSQINGFLGSVTQNAEGEYSGVGHYLQRFKCMNFLINGADGPQYQAYTIGQAKGLMEKKVLNGSDKITTFSNVVRFSLFKADSTGTTTIQLIKPTLFSPGNTVLVVGDSLPSISANIVSISGNSVVLNKTIPKEFKMGAKAGIIKEL